MPHPFLTYLGEPFKVVQVWQEEKCRTCFRVIRVRERCGFFAQQPERPLPTGFCDEFNVVARHECRDCLNSEPLTDFNKWRTDHEQHNEPARAGS